MIEKIFTYGTLMSGCKNHNVLIRNLKNKEDLLEIKEASFQGAKIYDTGFSYPLAIKSDNTTIKGEIITFKDKDGYMLSVLDYLENGYYRERIKINNEECWMYFATNGLFKISLNLEIKSNCWKTYTKNN